MSYVSPSAFVEEMASPLKFVIVTRVVAFVGEGTLRLPRLDSRCRKEIVLWIGWEGHQHHPKVLKVRRERERERERERKRERERERDKE